MKDHDDTMSRTPAEEDPVLHRHLVALPAFAPRTLFEDHVLARVWRPDPEWVRNVRFAGEDLVESGRVWLLIGAVTFGSLIPLAVLLGGGAAFATEISAGFEWLFREGVPTLRSAVAADLSRASSQFETRVSSLPLTADALRLGVAAALPLLGVCAYGLSRTMRAKRSGGDGR
ncbi:MAG: hypothetical protein PVH40_07725 [Gemmatimonadales bacterium]